MSVSHDANNRFVDVESTRLAYRKFGKPGSVPLVLCHRFRGTLDHWDPALLDVLASEREVIVFDNAGVGFSTGDAPDSVAGMAHFAERFIRTLGLSKVDVLGWSMGGTVAQQLTLDHPDLVRRLVLAGTSPGGVTDAPRAPEKVWQVAGKPVNDDEDFLYLFYTESQNSREAGMASLKRIALRQAKSQANVRLESVMAQVKAIQAWGAGNNSALPRLGEISAPTFVANGVHDIMVHAYNSYAIAQKTPHAELILYPDAGHAFLFQYAERFGRDVLRFLK
jgi:pimeloyl-ACP methyl ester carboxylesterase